MGRYIPSGFYRGEDVSGLSQAVWAELQRLALVINAMSELNLPTLHVAPAKPQEGDVRKADGTDWNPGSGAGVYVYQAGAWVQL